MEVERGLPRLGLSLQQDLITTLGSYPGLLQAAQLVISRML